MKKLLTIAAIFAGGMLFQEWACQDLIDDGEVIHEDDEKYIRVTDSKSCGWSHAKVVWKKPLD